MDWNELFNSAFSSAASAYNSYTASQAGYTPLGNGNYVMPNGQIATVTPYGSTTSGTTMLLLLLIFGLGFFWLFKKA